MDNGNNQNEDKIELIDAPETQILLDPIKSEDLITAESTVDNLDSQISMAPQSFDMVRPTIVNSVVDKAEENIIQNDFISAVDEPIQEAIQPIVPVEQVSELNEHKECCHKRSALSTTLIVLLVISLIAIAAFGGYMFRDKTAADLNAQQSSEIDSLKTEKTNLSKQLADKTAEFDADSFISPATTIIDSIKSSITSKNTAALEGYMSKSVIAIDGSSFNSTGDTTVTQVVSRITNFIKDATTPWDFDLSDTLKDSYSKIDYKMSNNLIIGKSANGKIISFTFDSNGKVSSVLLAANENLLK